VSDQRAHIIPEECVKADVSEAELVVAASELLLPIRAEREDRPAASDGVLPRRAAAGRPPPTDGR